jgi:hypothetical protein
MVTAALQNYLKPDKCQTTEEIAWLSKVCTSLTSHSKM